MGQTTPYVLTAICSTPGTNVQKCWNLRQQYQTYVLYPCTVVPADLVEVLTARAAPHRLTFEGRVRAEGTLRARGSLDRAEVAYLLWACSLQS